MSRRKKPVPTLAEMEAEDEQRRAASLFYESECGRCGHPRALHVLVPAPFLGPQGSGDIWICPTATFRDRSDTHD